MKVSMNVEGMNYDVNLIDGTATQQFINTLPVKAQVSRSGVSAPISIPLKNFSIDRTKKTNLEIYGSSEKLYLYVTTEGTEVHSRVGFINASDLIERLSEKNCADVLIYQNS